MDVPLTNLLVQLPYSSSPLSALELVHMPVLELLQNNYHNRYKSFSFQHHHTSAILTQSKWTTPTTTSNRISTHVPWMLGWLRLMHSHPLSQYEYHNIRWVMRPLAKANKACTHK
jgi:hypothetical protein